MNDRPKKKRGPKPKKLPSLPVSQKLNLKSPRKLSVAERDMVLTMLARGTRVPEIRNWLREQQGTEITAAGIHAYKKNQAQEIAARRKLYLSDMDAVPLRHRAVRLRELARMYELAMRQHYRERCSDCLGTGVLRVPGEKKGDMVSVRCDKCRGFGLVLPSEAQDYQLGDDVMEDARRLEGMRSPIGWSAEAWEKQLICLKEIREEVGDHVEKKQGSAEEIESLARASALMSFKTMLDKMSSEERIEAMQAVGRLRGKKFDEGEV